HEVADKVARQGEQGDDYALIGYVCAHAAGEDAGLRVARLAAHDVPLRLLHAQGQGGEAVRHEVYPQKMHRLQDGEAQKRRREDADDLRDVGAQQKLDGLADVAVYPPALLDGADDGGEVVVREDHVRDVLGDVRAGYAHADADVGALDAGRVVDAVAGHGRDHARALPGRDYAGLVLGLDPRVDGDAAEALLKFLVVHGVKLAAGDGLGGVLQDAQLLGDGDGGVDVVAGYHDGADARAAALLYGRLHLGADRAYHAREADKAELLLQSLGGESLRGPLPPAGRGGQNGPRPAAQGLVAAGR